MLYLHILYLYEYYEVMNVFLIKKKINFLVPLWTKLDNASVKSHFKNNEAVPLY